MKHPNVTAEHISKVLDNPKENSMTKNTAKLIYRKRFSKLMENGNE